MNLHNSDFEKIRQVVAILEKEFKYHYTHQQLSLKVGINESRLRVAFKQIYKSTIHEYLTQIRITKVKDLLLSTDWPLQAIATYCGFANSSLLIRHFKKSTSLTPLQWKTAANKVKL